MVSSSNPQIGIVMGSQSDWDVMQYSTDVLQTLKIPHEVKIVSAHRTPDRLYQYAREAQERGIQVIIAGAGGAAHLPGMLASMTTLPVLGVPVNSKHLKGMDSLLSIVQMPGGIPVGTLAIGEAGAKNAAYLAAQIHGVTDKDLHQKLIAEREENAKAVIAKDAALQEQLKQQ